MTHQPPVWVDPHWCLSTDLYELSMTIGYWSYAMDFPATFELSFRSMVPNRGYYIAAGVETAIEYILNLRFDEDSIAYLMGLPQYQAVPPPFWNWLRNFRFKGDIWAVPEGTPIFENEPVLQVTGPITQVQLLETFVLSTMSYQTLIATKASRVVLSAQGRPVVEFGLRRAHSPEAGFWAARASYIGGCVGTSNLLAGYRLGIPVYGTAAHSWTLACESEFQAFERFQKLFPEHTILLVDTYDVEEGIRNALKLKGAFKAIRIDSGDLSEEARKARKLLDEAGLQDVKIILSGDLNEFKIKDLIDRGTPVDMFGVGTELVVSRDQPSLPAIYKLVEWEKNGEKIPKMKFSPQKMTLPGKKQVYRFTSVTGKYEGDLIMLEGERSFGGEPLLQKVVENGERIIEWPSLDAIREYTLSELEALPDGVKKFEDPDSYTVELSLELKNLIEKLSEKP